MRSEARLGEKAAERQALRAEFFAGVETPPFRKASRGGKMWTCEVSSADWLGDLWNLVVADPQGKNPP
jgi:hypothetical protein